MLTGRVIQAHRTNFTVLCGEDLYTATVRGSFHDNGQFPRVGDYIEGEEVTAEQMVISNVLPRTSEIVRVREDGETQILVTNVDQIFIVMGVDEDFNINRLERYLLLAKRSNVPAVVVLNKIDLVADISPYKEKVQAIVHDSPLLLVSALSGVNMEQLHGLIGDGTVVLLGSSGAGKSTITNWLLDEARQAVGETRAADGRGRHTTTSRELFALPFGGFLIDTPGMRELGIIEAENDDEMQLFTTIAHYAEQCRFRNCDHLESAGCAVQTALANGDLSERQFENYQKLASEKAWQTTPGRGAANKYKAQTDKRKQQKLEQDRRRRLSGG